MTKRFHLNPASGDVGQCRAGAKACPFGEQNHFAHESQARKVYELSMGSVFHDELNLGAPTTGMELHYSRLPYGSTFPMFERGGLITRAFGKVGVVEASPARCLAFMVSKISNPKDIDQTLHNPTDPAIASAFPEECRPLLLAALNNPALSETTYRRIVESCSDEVIARAASQHVYADRATRRDLKRTLRKLKH